MRATRRLIGLCLAVGLALCPAAGSDIPPDRPAESVRSKTGTPSPELRDLYFGEALYHAFQGQYFDAIQRLDTELGMYHGLDQPELDTLHYHINDAEFSVGDFELNYRMHHRAGRAIKAVLEGAVDESVRNEAAFRLARIHFQKGQLDDAQHALERIQGTVPAQISDDVELLRAGWAEATAKHYDRALVPWNILAARERTDVAVQEAMLAVPSAYASLNLHGRAALTYGRALELFTNQIQRVDASINSIREGRF